MENPPPPPQIVTADPPKKKGWSTAPRKGNPLNIEEVLARKREADAAAAKVRTEPQQLQARSIDVGCKAMLGTASLWSSSTARYWQGFTLTFS